MIYLLHDTFSMASCLNDESKYTIIGGGENHDSTDIFTGH